MATIGVLGWGSCFSCLTLMATTEAAKSTTCYSKLQQIAQGMLVYASDHDGLLPPSDRWVDLSPLSQMVSGKEWKGCPSWYGNGFGYSMSVSVSAKDVAAVRKPAVTALVFDFDAPRPNTSADPSNLPSPPRHGGLVLFGGVKPHNNVAYADGHVERR